MYDNTLEHHGIPGMHWGIRRFQNYDGTLIRSGKPAYNYKKTKYTNLDGSMNEEGKLHKAKYVSKEIAKNDKYYNRHIDRYNKLAEKFKNDPETHAKFKKLAEDAENDRKRVNDYLNNMSFDEVRGNEKYIRDKRLQAMAKVGKVAAIAALPVGFGIGAKYLSSIDPMTKMSQFEKLLDTPVGQKTLEYVDAGLRTYSDIKSYAFLTMADQSLGRIKESGVLNEVSAMIAETSRDSGLTRVGNQISDATDYLKKLR